MNIDNKTHRQVRLLVVDPQGHLLLKRDASLTPWKTLGGELLNDEDYPAAAIRLLHEEAGLSCPLGPLLRQRELIEATGHPVEERFFLVRCPEHHDSEQGSLQGELLLTATTAAVPLYQWWPLAEMQRTEAAQFSPSWLPELMASVLFSETMMPASTARL
ncbi:NUDIX domain-containing protein [Vreelandella aquamarina]|uniref:NUDIX domain-containing protein n=1 Tax=Vreelandella aquamarina TaxID=77097 RepID=UPI003850414E